jgi:hypothetical protein
LHAYFSGRSQKIKNPEGQELSIAQVGWAGIRLSKIEVYFYFIIIRKNYKTAPIIKFYKGGKNFSNFQIYSKKNFIFFLPKYVANTNNQVIFTNKFMLTISKYEYILKFFKL